MSEWQFRCGSNVDDNEQLTAAEEYAPTSPYARDLAVLRAASATPESRFEDEYKASRLRDLAGEDGRLAEFRAARDLAEPTLVVLSEAELAKYAPPNPYTAGIKALQAKEARK